MSEASHEDLYLVIFVRTAPKMASVFLLISLGNPQKQGTLKKRRPYLVSVDPGRMKIGLIIRGLTHCGHPPPWEAPVFKSAYVKVFHCKSFTRLLWSRVDSIPKKGIIDSSFLVKG